jgi:uncharacterized protein
MVKMVDLKDRLGKLGFLPASSIRSSPKTKVSQFEDLVDGKRIYNNQGDVVLLERLYPYGSTYGNCEILRPAEKYEIFKFSSKDRKSVFSSNQIFIDTETTGLSGGTGTIPFLIGFGFFDCDGFTIKQLFLENPINEMAQLIEFSRDLQKFRTTVTFNGKSFDLPLIKTRFLLNRLENPMESFSHIDLLHISRKIWKKRLTDRSLKELESRIIDFSRNQEDVPGWLIPQIYFDFLRTGDGSQIKNVVYHNEIDIMSMAVLYQKIESLLLRSHEIDDLDHLDIYSIAKMYFQVGEFDRSISLFEKCVFYEDFSTEIKCDIHMTMADIYKKSEQFEKALIHWVDCAEFNSIDACIEIAKYFEHKVDQANEAIKWTLKALEYVDNSSLPRFEKIRNINTINKRLNRLSRRKNNV